MKGAKMKVKTFLSSSLLKLAGLLLISLMFLIGLQPKALAVGEFETTWQTDVIDPADRSILIPTYSASAYDYTVDWGDGNVDTNVAGDASHTYATAGTYTVKISGDFPRMYFNNYSDAQKLQTIDAWGVIEWESMNDAFEGASNLVVNATDAPDLSNVTSLSGMFVGASSLNQAVGHWDVSSVTNFAYMFEGASAFDQDLSTWDMSSAQTLLGMFYGASSFNQDVSAWDVKRVKSTNSTFRGATLFNQPLNSWELDDIEDTRYMFSGATSFNQDLSSWRLPNVNKMDEMFRNATAFDQSVGDWDVDSLQRADFMFNGSGLSPSNYDATLLGWMGDNVNNDVVFYVGNVTYCNGLPAVNYLLGLGWFMQDSGFDTSTCGPSDINLANQGNLQINEDLQSGEVIGTFESVNVDVNDTHTYSLNCTVSFSDSSFFTFNGDQLASNIVFDYDNPADNNADNVYDICIRSTDPDGNSVDKQFSITVQDVQEQQQDEDDNGVVVTGGAVLGTSTSNSNNSSNSGGQVLGDSDGGVLSDTGQGATQSIIAGGVLIFVSAAMFVSRIRKRIVYSFYEE